MSCKFYPGWWDILTIIYRKIVKTYLLFAVYYYKPQNNIYLRIFIFTVGLKMKWPLRNHLLKIGAWRLIWHIFAFLRLKFNFSKSWFVYILTSFCLVKRVSPTNFQKKMVLLNSRVKSITISYNSIDSQVSFSTDHNS